MLDVAPLMAVSEVEQVPELEAVYHWYEYGVVPPDGLAVNVMLWPLSMVGLDGVIAPAVNELPVACTEPKVVVGITPLGGYVLVRSHRKFAVSCVSCNII